MISEEEIKLKVRLVVAEHLAAKLMAILFVKSAYSDEQVAEVVHGIVAKYAVDTYPGADAALSDLLAAEAEEAVQSLLTRASEMRG